LLAPPAPVRPTTLFFDKVGALQRRRPPRLNNAPFFSRLPWNPVLATSQTIVYELIKSPHSNLTVGLRSSFHCASVSAIRRVYTERSRKTKELLIVSASPQLLRIPPGAYFFPESVDLRWPLPDCPTFVFRAQPAPPIWNPTICYNSLSSSHDRTDVSILSTKAMSRCVVRVSLSQGPGGPSIVPTAPATVTRVVLGNPNCSPRPLRTD